MDTLYQEMKKSAEKNASNTAIVFYGKRYTFGQILSLVDKASASLINLGVKKGDTVTLCMPNTPSAQIAFYAINRLGGIVNLVHPFISALQLNISLRETNSKLLIAYDLFLREKGKDLKTEATVLQSRSDYFMNLPAKIYFKLTNRKKPKYICRLFESLFNTDLSNEKPAEFKQNQPAVYLPSGGTSGKPKIIMHNNSVFSELCSHAPFFLSDSLKNYDAMYSVLPIFHGFGLCMNMHMCAVIGIKNVMTIKFNAASMIKAIRKEKINVITGVPAMYSKLLACKKLKKADLSSIKDCFVGGDSAPKKVVEDFNAALRAGGSKSRLYVGYGLTETVTVCTVTCDKHYKEGSIGYPLPNTKIVTVDKQGNRLPSGEIGEICVSTPLLMLGYLGQAESPIRDIDGEKWLFTGDLGHIDNDGFLFFKQRIKNMIKVSGVPVYPSEIEEVVEGISGVVRAAAIGVPDEMAGEAVKLYVESLEKDTDALKKNITSECAKKLMRYAVPKYIEVRQSLPTSAIGKVDRKKL